MFTAKKNQLIRNFFELTFVAKKIVGYVYDVKHNLHFFSDAPNRNL